MIDQITAPISMETEPVIAPIFCPDNRSFWDIVRRLLIWLLHELDKAYGYRTFERK